jgi:glyoxylase-like metal-dependent hydrolase (beta-lactamase superfamily II)
MLRWTVGEVEVVRVDASNFTLPTDDPQPAWAVPGFTPAVTQAPIAFSALAIRSGSTRIVVDPWIVDDSVRARPDAGAVIDAHLAELAAVGFAADDIDLVVNSHIDGIGWNTRPSGAGADDPWVPTFPRARYLFPRAEIAALDDGTPINGGEHLGPVRDSGRFEPVAPGPLTPEVSLVDAPGHNWGHYAVRIDSGDGGLAMYLGHLVLNLQQVDEPDRDIGDTDVLVAGATRRRALDELAERDGLLLTTLVGGAGGGRVARGEGDGYRLVIA